eukprot:745925-Hanusia_phi.AAC.1
MLAHLLLHVHYLLAQDHGVVGKVVFLLEAKSAHTVAPRFQLRDIKRVGKVSADRQFVGRLKNQREHFPYDQGDAFFQVFSRVAVQDSQEREEGDEEREYCTQETRSCRIPQSCQGQLKFLSAVSNIKAESLRRRMKDKHLQRRYDRRWYHPLSLDECVYALTQTLQGEVREATMEQRGEPSDSGPSTSRRCSRSSSALALSCLVAPGSAARV